jgi:hypothetical protein
VAVGFEPLLDPRLGLGIALERQVAGRVQIDWPLVLVGVLEERERAAVGEGEERVDVLAESARAGAVDRRPVSAHGNPGAACT